jgi:hypothetical protein
LEKSSIYLNFFIESGNILGMERHQSGKESVSPELRHLIGFTDVYNP